jgi:hypothetical protein
MSSGDRRTKHFEGWRNSITPRAPRDKKTARANISRRIGFKFQVSGFKFQVSGFKFQVSGFRFQVSGFRSAGSLFFNLKPET